LRGTEVDIRDNDGVLGEVNTTQMASGSTLAFRLLFLGVEFLNLGLRVEDLLDDIVNRWFLFFLRNFLWVKNFSNLVFDGGFLVAGFLALHLGVTAAYHHATARVDLDGIDSSDKAGKGDSS
jgi:hypothetical protein